MRKAGGYAVICDAGRQVEHDSFTCRHCQAITMVGPRQRPEDIGGLCKVCMGLICSRCVGQVCKTVERRLEEMEASHEARRSYGLV